MSNQITTMFAQSYSKKKPALTSQQGSNVKVKFIKSKKLSKPMCGCGCNG